MNPVLVGASILRIEINMYTECHLKKEILLYKPSPALVEMDFKARHQGCNYSSEPCRPCGLLLTCTSLLPLLHAPAPPVSHPTLLKGSYITLAITLWEDQRVQYTVKSSIYFVTCFTSLLASQKRDFGADILDIYFFLHIYIFLICISFPASYINFTVRQIT